MFKFHLVLTLFFSSAVLTLNAQEIVTTSGLNASGAGGTISYSIGQVSVAQNTGTEGSVLEGVQQPYIIDPTVGSEIANINLKLATYPNPTSDEIILTAEDLDLENLSYQLLSSEGKVLISKATIESTSNINLQLYPANTYLLNIYMDLIIIKSFRIIKN
ncbi:T9SS type A sorting domain-containing protein [bacterium]|nr:T9SS type A sorting domain-containing protein [bacterium]